MLAKHADEAGAWLHGVKVFRYSDETAEACLLYTSSMGREIGDILIQTNSILLEELKEDIVNGDGTIDEIADPQ